MGTRYIKTSYWTDMSIVGLSQASKYLYLYLITSPHSNIAGCYALPDAIVMAETGLDRDTIIESLKELIDKKLVCYDERTGEVLLLNFPKHNWGNSPKIKAAVRERCEYIRSEKFKNYLLSILTAVSTYTDKLKEEVSQ